MAATLHGNFQVGIDADVTDISGVFPSAAAARVFWDGAEMY